MSLPDKHFEAIERLIYDAFYQGFLAWPKTEDDELFGNVLARFGYTDEDITRKINEALNED